MTTPLPTEILSASGPTDITSFTSAKVKALYFSSSWCGICKELTPKLVDLFNEVNKSENQLQVLFISGDMSEEDFETYYTKMPWLAVPFGEDATEELAEHYKVSALPSIILVDSNGKVIKDKAQNDLKGIETGSLGKVFESWKTLYA